MKNQESLRIFHPSDTYDFINGQLILADKPEGWTSFDVVNYCRSTIRKYHEIKKIKVGHAGTLDPFASGLLLVCSGPYTKRIDELQNMPKVYSGIMELGCTTPSLDTETEIINKTAYQHINPEEILKVKEQFLGEIQTCL
jgi:tRNA pseudouridine55 synthase